MKKILIACLMVFLLCLLLATAVGAKEADVVEIPENLLYENDTAQYFVVFEGEEYYSGGSTINGLNATVIEEQLTALEATYEDIRSGLGTTYLTKFIFPDTMGGSTVTYVNFGQGLKDHAYFKGVCGAVVFPSSMTTITDMNNSVAQLRSIDFGENSQLSVIPNSFATMSNGGAQTKLKEVKNFPRNLTKIDQYAFAGCVYAFSGELYISASQVGKGAFNNALTMVTGIVFGPNFTSCATQAFTVRNDSTELPLDLRNYINENGLALRYIEFQCDVTQIDILTSAMNSGSFYFTSGSMRAPYSNLSCFILSNENNQSTYLDSNGEEVAIEWGKTTIHDLLGYKALFNDTDGADDYVYPSHDLVSGSNGCYGTCSRCAKEEKLQNPAHEHTSWTITGINGEVNYFEKLLGTKLCTDCNTVLVDSQEYGPFFDYVGYSKFIDGINYAITHAFIVNKEEISAFEADTGNDVKFGLVAGVKEGNTIQTNDLSTYSYDVLELKIVGIPEGELDTPLICGAYVTLNEETLYLDANEAMNGGKTVAEFSGVTYNQIS